MRRNRWLGIGFALLALGVATLALPASVEGPVRVPISEGHALTALDGVGALLCTAGTTALYTGLWRRRDFLARRIRQRPGTGIGIAFVGGAGLGLLLASAFSGFWWWWAIGAGIYAAALAVACRAAARTSPEA